MNKEAIARIFAEHGSSDAEVGQVVLSRSIQPGEPISLLPIDALTDFPKQPFKPYTPSQLELLRESIIQNGILTPLLVRPFHNQYQILSGHNRRAAARLAGYTSIPCIIRDMEDDQAILTVVETNLRQRETLLPSEKAWAYRIRLEAMKRQGYRTDLTSTHSVSKLQMEESACTTSTHSVSKLHANTGTAAGLTCGPVGHKSRDMLSNDKSGRQVQRYIRLTYLEPPLLEAVDEQKIGFGVGVTLSYLSTKNQLLVYNFFIVTHHRHIDQHLADQLRELDAGDLTEEELQKFLSPAVTKPLRKVSVTMKPLRRYFPAEATPKEIEKKIVEIVSDYFKTQSDTP